MQERTIDDIKVSEAECAVLRSARRDGFVSAKLYSNGDFSEEGFLYFGQLEVLCMKGLLKFVDRAGESERAPGDVRMIFTLADDAGERMPACAS